MQSQDWTNIIISASGIIAFIFWRFVVPKLPAHVQVAINNETATTGRVVKEVVQAIEIQSKGEIPGDEKKREAVKRAQSLLEHKNIKGVSHEELDTLIDSAVLLMNIALGKYSKQEPPQQQQFQGRR